MQRTPEGEAVGSFCQCPYSLSYLKRPCIYKWDGSNLILYSAACPQLALRLSDASTVSLSDGTLDFTVTLGYTTSSKSTPGQPIVLKLFGPKAEGPLSENAIYWGQYQIFLSSENIGEHRVPFEFHNMSLRRPRDANGRFLEMSDNAFTYVVSRAEGWIELSPGQEVSRRVTLRLDQDAAWQRVIRAGRDYWLRWAPSGTVGNPKELDKWKYGGLQVRHRAVMKVRYQRSSPLLTRSLLQDWEGVICDKRKDEFWIPIPVQAEEHGLRFKVVEGLN